MADVLESAGRNQILRKKVKQHALCQWCRYDNNGENVVGSYAIYVLLSGTRSVGLGSAPKIVSSILSPDETKIFISIFRININVHFAFGYS